MRLSANTPERADDDPVLDLDLDHCGAPNCNCGKPKLQHLLATLGPSQGMPSKVHDSASTTSSEIELPESISDYELIPEQAQELAQKESISGSAADSASASEMLSSMLSHGLPVTRRVRGKTSHAEGDDHPHPYAPEAIAATWDEHNRFHLHDSLSSQCPICTASLQRRKAARRGSGNDNAQQLQSAGTFGEHLVLDTIDYSRNGRRAFWGGLFDTISQ